MVRGVRIADGMMHETEWMFLEKELFTNNHWLGYNNNL